MKKFFHKISKYLSEQSIQTVLIISFALMLMIGIGSITLVFSIRSQMQSMNTLADHNIKTLDTTNQYLDSHLRNMMRASDAVYYQVLNRKHANKDTISEMITTFYNADREHVVSIALFDTSGDVIAAAPLSRVKNKDMVIKAPGFSDALNEIENIHFSVPHVQNIFQNEDSNYQWVVSLSRYVRVNYGNETINGVLIVDINFSGIEQVCRSAGLQDGSYLYLIDQNGEIIYHPRQQLVYSGIEAENNIKAVQYEDGSHIETFQKQKQMVTVKTVGYTGWKLVAITPQSVYQNIDTQMYSSAIFIFILVAASMLFISNIISIRIADPIKSLQQGMKDITNGNLELQLRGDGSKEINHLATSINAMVENMRELLNSAIAEQESKRKMELDALQTQINPHFLYNTLDSIVWMVENERYEGAVTMIGALARLFRISLSKGKSIITIADEIQHAESYLIIQSVRYKNRFTYRLDIDQNLLHYSTLKLVLQPFIENAIYHGLQYLEEDDGGELIVRLFEKDDLIYLQVEDNGSGMTPDTLEHLFDEKKKEKRQKGSGIGVINVKKRLDIYYGSPYGLSVESEADEGTTITICLPKRELSEVIQE